MKSPLQKVIRNEFFTQLGFIVSYTMAGIYQYYVIKNCIEECDDHNLTISIGVALVLFTIPVSIFHSYKHWSNFRKPEMQSQVIRILWMVSLYIV